MLIELVESQNHDETLNIFYNIDALRSGLNYALDNEKLFNKNPEHLELLLKQIKIQFSVDSSIIEYKI
jgi:hypothetical protein